MGNPFLLFNNNVLSCQTITIHLFILFFVAPTEGTLSSKWAEIANNVILPYKVDTFPRASSVVGPNSNNDNKSGQFLEVNLYSEVYSSL